VVDQDGEHHHRGEQDAELDHARRRARRRQRSIAPNRPKYVEWPTVTRQRSAWRAM
jgi:hypothetical protein